MTTEQDYRRGYAQGYAAAARDAKSPRLIKFLLEYITPWQYELNAAKAAPPKIEVPCGDYAAVRAALVEELKLWDLWIVDGGIDRLADVTHRAAK